MSQIRPYPWTCPNPDHDLDLTLPHHDPITKTLTLIPTLTQSQTSHDTNSGSNYCMIPNYPLCLCVPPFHLGGLWPSGDPLGSACVSQGAESLRKALG